MRSLFKSPMRKSSSDDANNDGNSSLSSSNRSANRRRRNGSRQMNNSNSNSQHNEHSGHSHSSHSTSTGHRRNPSGGSRDPDGALMSGPSVYPPSHLRGTSTASAPTGSPQSMREHNRANSDPPRLHDLPENNHGDPLSSRSAQADPLSSLTTNSSSNRESSQSLQAGMDSSYRSSTQSQSGGASVRSMQTVTSTSSAGAYTILRTSVGPPQAYRIIVPPGVPPGGTFLVQAGERQVRVACPPSSVAGDPIQIELPAEQRTKTRKLTPAVLTSTTGAPGGGAEAMTATVHEINRTAEREGGVARTMLIEIPEGVEPGQEFIATAPDNQKFHVKCPEGARGGRMIRIVPPPEKVEETPAPTLEHFQVRVPAGVQPGQSFALVANGQRVLVQCPPSVTTGELIKFSLPVAQVAGSIKLAYESQGGWKRTINLSNMKFQWVRTSADGAEENDNASVASSNHLQQQTVEKVKEFDLGKSAFVRKLTFMEGNDARMRTGRLQLISADEASVDSELSDKGKPLLSYADIAASQGKSLKGKEDWFHDLCWKLGAPWEEGHIKIVVRRYNLLEDSVQAVMSLDREDMRKRWRFEFVNEPGIDAGGLTREWFQLVTEQLFDPSFGLWLSSLNNQACCDINPSSACACPEDDLIYYRFLGRVLGRALFDGQIVKGHMVRSVYKQILGWPITFEDIKNQDEEYYKSLKKLTEMEDVSYCCFDFSVAEDNMGVRNDVELVDGGADIEVTNENLSEYLEAILKYRLMGRVKPQLTELMLGFYDVVPEPALTVFDANELELILCGLPTIDMEDWKHNTLYSGSFEDTGVENQAVKWFWEVVEDDFDQELRARLLQFVTGTSGVPSGGFSGLQGLDGQLRMFTVHGVDLKVFKYPRAHTCFNRIDLPEYENKQELLDWLKSVVMAEFTFSDE